MAGVLAGFLQEFVGLGWSSIVLRTLLLTGESPGKVLSTTLLSDILLNLGGKIYTTNKTVEKGSSKDASLFSGLKLSTTLLASIAAMGYIETPYEKHLLVALNLILASLLAIRWKVDDRDVSSESQKSFPHASDRSSWRLNLYPILNQHSRLLHLSTLLPKVLVLGLFVPLHDANMLYALFLTAPALPALYIARRIRSRIGESVMGRLEATVFALKGLTTFIT